MQKYLEVLAINIVMVMVLVYYTFKKQDKM